MIDEKELIELMTKSGEAYLKGKTDEGNLYAKELIHKLDFSEKRDQDALLNILVNALVKNDEISILDDLHEAGFDFNAKLHNGYTLPLFFTRYPKFDSDDKIYKKMEKLGAKSIEDSVSAEKLHKFFEKNLCTYNPWWKNNIPFYDARCVIASKEENETVLELVKKISNESAEVMGNKGVSILHHLVWHNYYEAAEILLKNGVNPNVKGVLGKVSSDVGYIGTTPLHLACYMGNLKMAKLLIDNGADTTICDESGRNCFHYLSSIHFENILNTFTGQSKSIQQRLDIVSLLKCDINAKDNRGITPILYLLMNDRSSKFPQMFLQTYINSGADTTSVDENGNTLLMLAAANNHITAAMLLMKSKDILNLKNNVGDTALHIATRKGNFEIGYMLIEMGADSSVLNDDGETAADIINDGYNDNLKRRISSKRPDSPDILAKMVNEAFFYIGSEDNDRLDFAVYLVEKMLSEIDEDDDEEVANVINILHNALQEDPDGRIINAIAKSGFDLTMTISYQGSLTTVRDYCLNSFFGVDLVKRLIDLGVDMDSAFIKGKTPANIVARLEEKNTIRCSYLGEELPDIDYYAETAKLFGIESMEALDNEGKSALHWAAQRGHLEMMKVMLDKGANINLTDDFEKMAGTTPLELACIYGNVDMVKLLMERGADDSIQNDSGNTAAHYAVKEIESYIRVEYDKRAQMVELLENIDIPRDDGKTPLILLQTYYNNINAVKTITPILLDKGADVNHVDNDGNTALIVHTENHCERSTVKELIRAGADLNAQNNKGATALHNALRYGNTDVARLLIKKGANYEITDNNGETAVDIAVAKGYDTVLDLMN